ncbi:TetR/AcrR family transcriptional regulator [Puniceibacterium confluentis]|uniref:TetR/AcrR family transcriptional regulator n=1 Tax=Puniceibacterium confluentis TaxID=1958944 RepID=UPI0011B59BC3|nr:TetR/AcrR family transcriptional regulator [Puniceibacterium confluentis]
MSQTAVRLPSARDRLIKAAADLFYNDGIAATGIDAITRRAGVAKQSLYNNFSSKAELVAAYIDARHAEWLALYAIREAAAVGAREKILAVFDAYGDHAAGAYERGFRGCGLLNAAAELTSGDDARLAVRRHKEDVDAILACQLKTLLPGAPEQAEHLAAHLSFLLEGAMTRAGLEGNGRRVVQARAIARDILDTL